jgi:hypothetical protein
MPKEKGFNEYQINQDGTCEFYICKRNGEKITTVVDREDLDRLIEFNMRWHVCYYKNIDSYYVKRNNWIINPLDTKKRKHNKPMFLHKWLLGVEYNREINVDHINHKSLNNTRNNLRITDIFHNTKNRSGKNSNNKSGYRNVCWIYNKWVVQLMVDGKNTTLGKFDNLEEAGKFAEAKRKELYGEFAGEG